MLLWKFTIFLGCFYLLSSAINPFLYSLFSKRFRRGLYDFSRYCKGKSQIKNSTRGVKRIVPSLKSIGIGRNKGLEDILKFSLSNCYHTNIAANAFGPQSNHDTSSSEPHKFMSENIVMQKTMFELKRSTRYPDLDQSKLSPPTTPNIFMTHRKTSYKTRQHSYNSRKQSNSPTVGSFHKIKMEKQPSKYRVVFTNQSAHSEPLWISHLQKQSSVVKDRIRSQDTKISSDFLVNNHTYWLFSKKWNCIWIFVIVIIYISICNWIP